MNNMIDSNIFSEKDLSNDIINIIKNKEIEWDEYTHHKTARIHLENYTFDLVVRKNEMDRIYVIKYPLDNPKDIMMIKGDKIYDN